MAKLGNFKRINKSDFDQEIQPTIDLLAGSINDGFDSAYAALSGRLTLGDNMQGTLFTVNITVNADGTVKAKTVVPLKSAVRVVGLSVLRAENQSNAAGYPNNAPFITYRQLSASVDILHVTGLPANTPFLLTVFAYN